LLGNANVRKYFMKHHADLLSAAYWQSCKQRILDGHVDDVFPYPQECRFSYRAHPSGDHTTAAQAA
jgi:isocitrate dehydrogenase kinase/phosphatase